MVELFSAIYLVFAIGIAMSYVERLKDESCDAGEAEKKLCALNIIVSMGRDTIYG